MLFRSVNGIERPKRLCDSTRAFAFESLNHKYGLEARKTPAVSLDDIEGFESLSFIQKYDAAVMKIALDAPLRLCDGELISGAATLGHGIYHAVPAVYNGNVVCSSISHLTVDFETVLKHGVSHIKNNIEASLTKYAGSEKEEFLKSCLNCVNAFSVWHKRYLELLSEKSEYSVNYKNLQRVPFEPATDFHEAVQSLWFTFAFLRLCGNWPGIGRIDKMLGPYLKNDLESGALTLDEAREILAHFFIKGCEWITGESTISGDAQHYQNILLAGVDEEGNEVTNEVTYLVLDVLEELGISDFPTSVRLNSKSPEALLRRVAEVMRFGGGILAVYNEDLVIDALVRDGYELSEARAFANDGCWEVQIPGKTYFCYIPFDSLKILQQNTLKGYDSELDYPDFESLYSAYISDLRSSLEAMFNGIRGNFEDDNAFKWRKQFPCTVVSLFERGCIENGLSYLEGGPIYKLVSPHIGGIADTANSLFAIKKAVYDEKRLTLNELIAILKNNWEGEEALRQFVLNRYSYYGNDSDEVDLLLARLLSDFSGICRSFDGKCGFHIPAGVSTFGRQLEWAPHRSATPSGRKAGEILAANCSPTPATDKQGATAIIRSYCKLPLNSLASGAALDIKLLPSSVSGSDGLSALCALLRGFVELGGFFMQPDVVDASVLKEAQICPEQHTNLSVRVSGWNARFVTLNKEWQDMVIEQNEH